MKRKDFAVLVSTWRDGVFVVTATACRHELAGRSVQALTSDGRGGALAIVDGQSLWRRAQDGGWRLLAEDRAPLVCCVPVADEIYVGTEDAGMLRVRDGGKLTRLAGFDAVEGRDKWYAGSVVVDGQVVGPPLGVRSMTASADGKTILANVHVGGVPRSTDNGATWHPTIDIDSDVHEVRAHPVRSDIVIAAAAVGFCMSRDAGATWRIEQRGLHATYCSAVAFWEDTVLVAASEDHFARRGAVYQRPIEEQTPFRPIGAFGREFTEGIVDTSCIAAKGSALAVVDKGGNLYTCAGAGAAWSRSVDRIPEPASLLIV